MSSEEPVIAEFSGERFTDRRLGSLRNLDEIEFLSLFDTAVTDAGIELLRSATKLKEVHVTSDHITDASMTVFCTLPNLESLLISRAAKITDVGVKHISRASGLCELYLSGTQVTDRGLGCLSHLSALWSLDLSDTAVTDAGIRMLNGLTSLRLLLLKRSGVSGAGLTELCNNEHFGLYLAETPTDDNGVLAFAGKLTNLKDLDLSHTRVTDASAVVLRSLQKLDVLRLEGCKVTDATLAILCGHQTLSTIYLGGTAVSDAGVKALQRASRKLTIYA